MSDNVPSAPSETGQQHKHEDSAWRRFCRRQLDDHPLRFPHPVTLLWGAVVLAIGLGSATWLVCLVKHAGGKPVALAIEPRMVVASAVVGSSIASAQAYLKHAAERHDFRRRYGPWYVFRPMIGGLLALVFYFVLRAGLFASYPGYGDKPTDLALLVGLSGLVGLFSRNASEKLQDVFKTMFQTKNDALSDFYSGLPKEAQEAIKRYVPEGALPYNDDSEKPANPGETPAHVDDGGTED